MKYYLTTVLHLVKYFYMTYQWKKFENLHQRSEDRITVTKSESIGFPTKFYKDNKISQYKWVVLYYDEQQKAIGIKFTNDEAEKNKFTIVTNPNYGGGVIARSFFRSNNIDTKNYYGRYEWEKDNQGEMGELYVIKLSEKNPLATPINEGLQPQADQVGGIPAQ